MEEKFEVHKIVLPERILENDWVQIEVPRVPVPQGDCRENWGCTSITGWEDVCADRGYQSTRDGKPRLAFAAYSGAEFGKDM